MSGFGGIADIAACLPLAVIINEFGVGDEKALVMLKALHTVSMV